MDFFRYARYPRVDFGEGGDRNSSIFQLIMNVIKFYIGNIRECYKALFVSVRLDTRQTQRRARTINPFPRLRHLIYRENLSSVKVSAIYFFDGGPYRRTPVFGGAPAGASACPLSLRARLSIREYPNPECVAKMFTSLEKVGILCITIVGFQITRFLLRVLYNNVIAVKLRINAVNLEEMGKWAGKRVLMVRFWCETMRMNYVYGANNSNVRSRHRGNGRSGQSVFRSTSKEGL